MVMTRSADETTEVGYRCVLCGRPFRLPHAQAALPAHRYPTGLYRGRPCASTFGTRA